MDLSAFVSIVMGIIQAVILLFLGNWLRGQSQDIRALKKEVHEDLKSRIGKAEDLARRHASGCTGPENARRIVDLEDRAKRGEFAAGEITRKIEGIQATLANQITTFRDLSGRIQHYMEETATQRAEIKNLTGYLNDVAKDTREHIRDRSAHNG